MAVSDPLEHRREKAKEFGANLVINPTTENISTEAAKYGISDFNKIIFACAATSEMNNILTLCARGGVIVLFSGFSGTGLCSITLNSIHYKEIELIGSSGYKRQNYLAAFSLLGNGYINVKSLISDIFSHRRIQCCL